MILQCNLINILMQDDQDAQNLSSTDKNPNVISEIDADTFITESSYVCYRLDATQHYYVVAKVIVHESDPLEIVGSGMVTSSPEEAWNDCRMEENLPVNKDIIIVRGQPEK